MALVLNVKPMDQPMTAPSGATDVFVHFFSRGLHPELPAAAPPGRFVVGSDTDCRELLKRVVDLFRLQQLPILKMIGQPTKSATHNLANHLTVWHKRTQLAAIRST